MKIETYEEQEISEADPIESEQHRQLAEKMGLDNQVALHKASGHVDHYRRVTAEELFVFQMLFPNMVPVKNYEGGIPLRILQVIAHFQEVHPNIGVFLLCPQPGDPDPVVVATEYSWALTGKTYLLARFGSALEDFSVLSARAIQELKRRTASLEGLSWDRLDKIRAALKD